jgi:glycerol-3-phosphate dehydrogenase
MLSKEKTREMIPTIEPEGLVGGVIYYDGQFDDARLAINLAQTAAEQGAVRLNYVEVTGLAEERERRGAGRAGRDAETVRSGRSAARVVINATGVFADRIRRHGRARTPT